MVSLLVTLKEVYLLLIRLTLRLDLIGRGLGLGRGLDLIGRTALIGRGLDLIGLGLDLLG
jgi:hypothetical protein